jgi:hypothetical protein
LTGATLRGMDSFNADRKKLEEAVFDAVERLARHMGTDTFLLPNKDGRVVASGSPEEVLALVKPLL